MTISAPSEAGRWSLWALSLSNRGLRFSSPRTINVFRPIQLDFALPPALKVGETVEVDVKITNNINNCMDVSIYELLYQIQKMYLVIIFNKTGPTMADVT